MGHTKYSQGAATCGDGNSPFLPGEIEIFVSSGVPVSPAKAHGTALSPWTPAEDKFCSLRQAGVLSKQENNSKPSTVAVREYSRPPKGPKLMVRGQKVQEGYFFPCLSQTTHKVQWTPAAGGRRLPVLAQLSRLQTKLHVHRLPGRRGVPTTRRIPGREKKQRCGRAMQ